MRRREDARNSLEAYLYRLRDLLEQDDSAPFIKCSQEKERQELSEKLQDTMSWIHEEADQADTVAFRNRRDALE